MIYFDNAATTYPKPQTVYNSVDHCLRNYCANPGRGSHKLSLECELKIFECRERIAKLLNIKDPLDIVFTKNTTEGLNIALRGSLISGDHVITTMIEHNSVLRPLESLRNKGVKVTILPVNTLGYLSINDVKNSIRKNTKAIIINHGSNVLGTIQDINSIGNITKALGILLIVDGAQTVGFQDIDVQIDNIDILAFPGHKSLFGLQGTGGLYIKKGLNLSPLMHGGTGSNSDSVLQPNFMPDKMESGTINTPGIVGLSEGINFILSKGIKNIRNHEISLITELTEELSKLPYIKIYGEKNPLLKTPVISFNVDGYDSSEIGMELNNREIYLRTSYHCAPLIHKIIHTSKIGTVRVSPGYFNTSQDIKKFIIALREIYKP